MFNVLDYLTDPARCKNKSLLVQLAESHSVVGMKCLDSLNMGLQANMCSVSPHELNVDVLDLADRIASIPGDVRYSAIYWIDHIANGIGNAMELLPRVEMFMRKKLLDWFEILSVVQKVETAILKLPILIDWLDHNGGAVELRTLTEDAWRFVQEFRIPIIASAAHVRWSALPFIPTETELYRTYVGSSDKALPAVLRGTDPHWPAYLQTLEGHTKLVTSVAISRDGSRVLTGSWDGTAKVWNAATGSLIWTLECHTECVRAVAIGNNDEYAVTGSSDGSAKLWDMQTGVLIRILGDLEERHTDAVTSVAISLNRSLVVTGSADTTVKVWDAETGCTTWTFKGHTKEVTSVNIIGDGARIISGSMDGNAIMWDVATGSLELTLSCFYGVECVAISMDYQLAATASRDRKVKVWEVATGSLLRTFEGHSLPIGSIALSGDNSVIAIGYGMDVYHCSISDPRVKLCDMQTGSVVKTLEGHAGCISSIAFSYDGKRLITGSEDRTCKVWDLTTEGSVRSGVYRATNEDAAILETAVMSTDGARIVTASLDTTATIWDMQSGSVLRRVERKPKQLTSVAMNADGTKIVAGSLHRAAEVWDLETGSCATLPVHAMSVAMSSDEPVIAVGGGRNGDVHVFNGDTLSLMWKVQGHFKHD